jgi:hypothetical protein
MHQDFSCQTAYTMWKTPVKCWHPCVVAQFSTHCHHLQCKAGRELDQIGPTRFMRMSAHCFGTYRHQKPVTAEKHIKPFTLKQVLAFCMLRNVLLCAVFWNCSDTCRRGLCRADAGLGLPLVSIEFYLCGLCRSDPVHAQLNMHFYPNCL